MTTIIDRLSIGNWQDAKANHGRMKIVTVAVDSPYVGDYKFDLVDGPGNSQAEFEEAVTAVVQCHLSGHDVLVHCVSGRSRSAAVTVRAVSSIKRIHLCDAYDLVAVKHDRTRIHPHLSELLLKSFSP